MIQHILMDEQYFRVTSRDRMILCVQIFVEKNEKNFY